MGDVGEDVLTSYDEALEDRVDDVVVNLRERGDHVPSLDEEFDQLLSLQLVKAPRLVVTYPAMNPTTS